MFFQILVVCSHHVLVLLSITVKCSNLVEKEIEIAKAKGEYSSGILTVRGKSVKVTPYTRIASHHIRPRMTDDMT